MASCGNPPDQYWLWRFILFAFCNPGLVLLKGFFIRPFYKMMLQKPITLRDMESVVCKHQDKLFFHISVLNSSGGWSLESFHFLEWFHRAALHLHYIWAFLSRTVSTTVPSSGYLRMIPPNWTSDSLLMKNFLGRLVSLQNLSRICSFLACLTITFDNEAVG